MFIQTIGVLLGIIGFAIEIPIVLIAGGILCVIADIIGFSSGKLNPIFPIVLYIIGYIIAQSWIGVLYGSIIGNAIEAIFLIIIFAIFLFNFAIFLFKKK